MAFADCWRAANVAYFTEFRPLDGISDIANALLVLGTDHEPVLPVSEQCLAYAESVTTFPVRPLIGRPHHRRLRGGRDRRHGLDHGLDRHEVRLGVVERLTKVF